jgi:hypothetical protein
MVTTQSDGTAYFPPANLEVQVTDVASGLALSGVVLGLFQDALGTRMQITDPSFHYPPKALAVANAAPNYLVGDAYPYTSNTAPNFGDWMLNIQDLIQELFAVNNLPGSVPPACSDRFDALDLYPVDSGTRRGGDGVLDIRDLIVELFRVNNLDPSRPVRASLGGACASGAGSDAADPTEAARKGGTSPVPQASAQGALVLGDPEKSGEAEERVPVYLEAKQDLLRAPVTFALGDQRSQLRFVASPRTPPSLAYDGQLGVVAAAWLDGVTGRAGERLLLGYVVGPAGVSAGLRIYGMSVADSRATLTQSAGHSAEALATAAPSSSPSVVQVQLSPASLGPITTPSSMQLPGCAQNSPFTSDSISCTSLPVAPPPTASSCSQQVSQLSQAQLAALVPLEAWGQACKLQYGAYADTIASCQITPSFTGVSLGDLQAQVVSQLGALGTGEAEGLPIGATVEIALDLLAPLAPEVVGPVEGALTLESILENGIDTVNLASEVDNALTLENYQAQGYTSDQCFAVGTVVGTEGGGFAGMVVGLVEPLGMPSDPPSESGGSLSVSLFGAAPGGAGALTTSSILISPVGLSAAAPNGHVTIPNLPPGSYIVTGQAPGFVSSGTTVSVTAGANTSVNLTLNTPGIFVANAPQNGPFSVNKYPITSKGDPQPIASIGGSKTGLNMPAATVVGPSGNIWVANLLPGDGSVAEFALGVVSNSAPTLTLAGPDTGLGGPVGLAFDGAGNLYVANRVGSVTVYGAGALAGLTGVQDLPPTAMISGGQTGLVSGGPAGIALDARGYIYVTNGEFGYSVAQFGPLVGLTGNQNVSPVATITGGSLEQPAGITVDTSGRIWVASQVNAAVSEFAPLAGKSVPQNLSPIVMIEGANTQLMNPYGVGLYPNGDIFVVDPEADAIMVYAAATVNSCSSAAPCNIAPARVISGPNTGLQQPGGAVALYPSMLP